jgi:hypothetical protein
MRKLLWVVLAAAALWAGYWVVGSQALQRGATAWLTARQADGWQADYRDLSVHGFPNRFDTTITDLALADPRTGVAWEAPLFQILALSYRPHHVIAVWPPEQTLATPYQRITMATDDMRASAVFVPGPSLALDHSTLVVDGARLTSTLGWEAGIERGRFSTRRTSAAPPDAHSHDIAIAATGYTPPRVLQRLLDPAGLLPGRVEGLRADMTMTFDRPWDRFAIENQRPQPRSLDLKSLTADWGRLSLRAAGQLTIDADGIPEGRITLRAENWREMVGLAVNAGLLPQGLARTVERGLELLAGLGGNPDVIEAPLSFQGGFVSFGPVPLGPAPRLTLR